MLDIRSNGSHWLGEAPDTIDQLLECLGEHPLNRIFEHYGNFYECENVELAGNRWKFFGNFLTVSHVFNITTDDPAIVASLRHAIDENRQRPDYKSQPDLNAESETFEAYCAKAA